MIVHYDVKSSSLRVYQAKSPALANLSLLRKPLQVILCIGRGESTEMYICQNGSKHAAISSKYTADPVSCSHLSLFVLPMADHVVVRHSALMRTALPILRLCTLLGLGGVQHTAKKIWLNRCIRAPTPTMTFSLKPSLFGTPFFQMKIYEIF